MKKFINVLALASGHNVLMHQRLSQALVVLRKINGVFELYPTYKVVKKKTCLGIEYQRQPSNTLPKDVVVEPSHTFTKSTCGDNASPLRCYLFCLPTVIRRNPIQ